MICQACKDRSHDDCRGGSWCDCQHQPPETIKAAKYGMYVPPAALDPEGILDEIGEIIDREYTDADTEAALGRISE